jgi:predicted transcriptional regulator
MKLESVREILDCQVIVGQGQLDKEVFVGCGADLMSDVLAFIKPSALLLTGLTNVQVVRTAEIAEVPAIVFVRGKFPSPQAIELAEEKEIVLMATNLPLYESCGRLYHCGLSGGFDILKDRANSEKKSIHSTI